MWPAPCSCTTGMRRMPAGAKMSIASMKAEPMMPNMSVTPLADQGLDEGLGGRHGLRAADVGNSAGAGRGGVVLAHGVASPVLNKRNIWFRKMCIDWNIKHTKPRRQPITSIIRDALYLNKDDALMPSQRSSGSLDRLSTRGLPSDAPTAALRPRANRNAGAAARIRLFSKLRQATTVVALNAN